MPKIGGWLETDHDKTLLGIIALVVVSVLAPVLIVFWYFDGVPDFAVERVQEILLDDKPSQVTD